MTSTVSARATSPLNRGTPRPRVSTDPRLLIAGALFLAVLIAEAILIASAGPTITGIGSLLITTT